MSVHYLFDTDVLIDIQRQHPAAIRWFSEVDPIATSVPVFVRLELIQDARNQAEAIACNKLVGNFDVVWPTDVGYQWAIEHYADLVLSRKIGVIDMLIAATAIERNATLYTFNLKHYRFIDRLSTIQPYSRL